VQHFFLMERQVVEPAAVAVRGGPTLEEERA